MPRPDDFFAATFRGQTYCVDCLAAGVDPDHEEVMVVRLRDRPIRIPVCTKCSFVHLIYAASSFATDGA